MKYCLIFLVHAFDCEPVKSDYYQWVDYESDLNNMMGVFSHFPNGNPICKALVNIDINHSPRSVFLAGEMVDQKCVYGWNDLEKTDKFKLLLPKCLPGTNLSWHIERQEMESVLDQVVVHVNDLSYPIGICSYNGNYGWKKGRS